MSDAVTRIISQLEALPPEDVRRAMLRLGFANADVALMLLRLGHRDAAIGILGPRFVVGPPALSRMREPPPPPARESRWDRRIRGVAPNPRTPGSDAARRYALLEPGKTLAQCVARGAMKRDVRNAIKRGWIDVE